MKQLRLCLLSLSLIHTYAARQLNPTKDFPSTPYNFYATRVSFCEPREYGRQRAAYHRTLVAIKGKTNPQDIGFLQSIDRALAYGNEDVRQKIVEGYMRKVVGRSSSFFHLINYISRFVLIRSRDKNREGDLFKKAMKNYLLKRQKYIIVAEVMADERKGVKTAPEAKGDPNSSQVVLLKLMRKMVQKIDFLYSIDLQKRVIVNTWKNVRQELEGELKAIGYSDEIWIKIQKKVIEEERCAADTLKYFLHTLEDISKTRDRYGQNLLHLLAIAPRIDLLSLCKEAGVDIEAKSGLNMSPMELASYVHTIPPFTNWLVPQDDVQSNKKDELAAFVFYWFYGKYMRYLESSEFAVVSNLFSTLQHKHGLPTCELSNFVNNKYEWIGANQGCLTELFQSIFLVKHFIKGDHIIARDGLKIDKKNFISWKLFSAYELVTQHMNQYTPMENAPEKMKKSYFVGLEKMSKALMCMWRQTREKTT